MRRLRPVHKPGIFGGRKVVSKLGLMSAVLALTLVFVPLRQSDSRRSNKVSNAPKEKTEQVATGVWGGEHISMRVTESGAEIEYDCAHGTIAYPLVLDGEGRFDVEGTHVRERGGPVRRGDKPDSHPARYTGSVNGQTMTLTVMLTETQETVDTFKLTEGNVGRVRKCR
jgi:hypothetical protein